MFLYINIFLGVILFISIVNILVKKILIGINGTDSGAMNLILITLVLVGLFSCLLVFIGVSKIDSFMSLLNAKGKPISAKELESTKEALLQTKTGNIIALLVGYGTLILDFIMFKIINRKKVLDLAKPKKHWNWNKINQK